MLHLTTAAGAGLVAFSLSRLRGPLAGFAGAALMAAALTHHRVLWNVSDAGLLRAVAACFLIAATAVLIRGSLPLVAVAGACASLGLQSHGSGGILLVGAAVLAVSGPRRGRWLRMVVTVFSAAATILLFSPGMFERIDLPLFHPATAMYSHDLPWLAAAVGAVTVCAFLPLGRRRGAADPDGRLVRFLAGTQGAFAFLVALRFADQSRYLLPVVPGVCALSVLVLLRLFDALLPTLAPRRRKLVGAIACGSLSLVALLSIEPRKVGRSYPDPAALAERLEQRGWTSDGVHLHLRAAEDLQMLRVQLSALLPEGARSTGALDQPRGPDDREEGEELVVLRWLRELLAPPDGWDRVGQPGEGWLVRSVAPWMDRAHAELRVVAADGRLDFCDRGGLRLPEVRNEGEDTSNAIPAVAGAATDSGVVVREADWRSFRVATSTLPMQFLRRLTDTGRREWDAAARRGCRGRRHRAGGELWQVPVWLLAAIPGSLPGNSYGIELVDQAGI